MKLYYSAGACSLAVRIIIHELNIPCQFEAVNLKTKQTEKGVDFLTINPKGSVPVLVLDDQSVLTENAVIQQYLAETGKTKTLLPPKTNFNHYRVLEWLNFVGTDLHKNFGPLFNPKIDEELKETLFKPIIKTKFDFVDRQLGKTAYLAGEHFTLPDAYLFVVTRWMPHFKFSISQWKNLSRYMETLVKRNAIKQSLREEGLAYKVDA